VSFGAEKSENHDILFSCPFSLLLVRVVRVALAAVMAFVTTGLQSICLNKFFLNKKKQSSSCFTLQLTNLLQTVHFL